MVNQERIFLMLIITLLGIEYSVAGFIETPSSITVEFASGVDRTVVFRCRYDQADGIIWKLNGGSILDYDGVVDSHIIEDGIRVDTLTVPVIPAYNRSTVVCSAIVDGSFVDTPAAVLIITGPGGFLRTPSLNIVAMEKGRVTFHCKHSTGTDIFWSVDAPSGDRIVTSIESVDLPGGGIASNLTIYTRLEHNQTSVECGVVVARGSPVQYAPVANLLIQGIPGSVSNIVFVRQPNSTILTAHWDSVFSLDLNDTEPDIVYEFEVYDITCGRNDLIHNNTVMANSTSNTIDPTQLYKVVVAARNNVANAVKGTGADVSETFLILNSSILFELNTKNQVNVNTTVTRPDPVPLYYVVNLTSSDGSNQVITRNVTVTRSRRKDLITLWLNEGIPPRTLWDASVSAYGCQEHIVKGIVLSTHEIQNLSVSSSEPGEIRVTGNFVDQQSTATGALVIVYSLTDDSNVHYITVDVEQCFDVHVTDLSASSYGVSVFVLEDGVPFEKAVAFPRFVIVSNDTLKVISTNHLSSFRYEVQSTSTGVCVNCTFLESSTTDCVAVVHQRISQLNSSGLMNIESSHKFTRSGDTASGCIEGVNLEDYQVGVVGGVNEQLDVGSKNAHVPCNMTCYVACAVAAFTVVSSIVFLMVCAVTVAVNKIRRRMRQREDNESSIEENVTTKRNEAYEITVLARQRVIMDKNPAYEQVCTSNINIRVC